MLIGNRPHTHHHPPPSRASLTGRVCVCVCLQIVRHRPLTAPGGAAPAPEAAKPAQVGVGAVLRREGGYVMVKELWAGASADMSQLVAVGDVVEMIGGKTTAGMDERELVRALMGTPGSMCVLQLWKPNSNSTRIEVALTRSHPVQPSPRSECPFRTHGLGFSGCGLQLAVVDVLRTLMDVLEAADPLPTLAWFIFVLCRRLIVTRVGRMSTEGGWSVKKASKHCAGAPLS